MKVVKFKKVNKDAIIPDYAHKGDAGLDLYAVKDEIINPFDYKLIGTGIAIELPSGTEAQIRSKSGIALKNGVFVLNSPGTIDENYRGEMGVMLYNLNKDKPFVVKKGEKIAQMVICNVEYVDLQEVSEMTNSERKGGFGSSGLAKKNND